MYSSAQQKAFLEQTKTYLAKQLTPEDYDAFVSLLHFHEWKYYVKNAAAISDLEYDTLFNKLKALENSPGLVVRPDSPTQRVSSDLSDDFPSVSHLRPMLSLGNSYNAEDLSDFDQQLKRLLLIATEDDLAYFIEPKFDGGSVALVYENDLLVRAATRGNGTEGNEMTLNAKALPSVPLKANFSKYGYHKVELRGEAIIRKETFDKVNQTRRENEQDEFANPRNAATGGLRMKNPNETRARGIEVFIFQIGHVEDKNGNDILI